MHRPLALTIALLATAAGPAPQTVQRLVACAPGYPGTTEQAQPTMDELAASVAQAAGMHPSAFRAEYRATEEAGLVRLADADVTLALVPLAFFLEHEEALRLRPLVQVIRRDGATTESWSLVAGRGRVRSADDLAGWELVSIAGYAEPFVRGAALGRWGRLGADVAISMPRRLLSDLRRASSGEHVALLLDEEQTGALAQLPDAGALEIVTSSPPLVAALVATVGDRVTSDQERTLRDAFLAMGAAAGSAELMETLRLSGFAPVDDGALQSARAAYRAAR